MGTRPSGAGARLRSGVACIGIIALLVPGPALPAPPVVDRAAPTPVTSVSGEELQRVAPSRDLQAILDYHNQLRAQVNAPPLQWDPQLAAQAAAYGPQLAQHGRPIHAPRKGRETSRENLLQALPGTSVDKMVGVWIAERQHFLPGTFPNVSRTGNWADVGHYTQMIWPTTTRVGCAVHRGGRFDWLICRYSPPGNQDGKPVIGLPPARVAQSPVINIDNPPRGPILQDAPDEEGADGGAENQDGGAVNQDDGGNVAGGTRERPRQPEEDPGLAAPDEGISRQTGNCGASVIARVKIIERRDPQKPNKKRRVKESHNLGHGFTEIVIPHGWDADVDWAADPNPAETFPDPGTMTASWAIVGQAARRNATITGDYGHLQKGLQRALAGESGWDREWGLLDIDPPNRPTVQQHRIEATWDPVPRTDPDSCPTDHDFTVTFAGQIDVPNRLDLETFMRDMKQNGFPGTRARQPQNDGTRSFHESQPRFRPGTRTSPPIVVVPLGTYWDLPEECCDIDDAERKVIQFARAAIHGPNGRQGKGWGLDVLPSEFERATKDRANGDQPTHDPTYTGHPRDNDNETPRANGPGGTRRNGDDLEQWDAPGMPKDLYDRLFAAQGASVYRQQFLSLLVCRPPGDRAAHHQTPFYLANGKVCEVAVTTVRWDFPGQANARIIPPRRRGQQPQIVYNQPRITVTFDVRDGNCIDLRAFLDANGLLDEFQNPDSEARNLEILKEAPYEELKRDVEIWERAPFAGIRFP